MGRCSRCGREGEVDYGADGLPYCTSCIFYGINKPCNRCRMYLPASELQQYKGQWACPYCIMDMRSEERGIEAGRSEGEKRLEGLATGESCERCGRSISTAYYVRGMKLCETCAEETKKEWKDVGGERPPMPMYRVKEKAVKEAGILSSLGSIFSEMLALVGLRKRQQKKRSEIVALTKEEARVAQRRTAYSGSGKKEEKEEAQKEKKEPMIEGLEKKEKKKSKKSQDISFAEFTAEDRDRKEKKKKKFTDFKDD